MTIFFCATLLACAALVTSLATEAWCAEPNWVLLDENADSRFYYDQRGAQNPNEGVVQVRTRVIYTESGKADALKILEASGKFKNLYETRYLHELNCEEQESRLLEVRHLDKEGVTLKTADLSSVAEWEAIPPFARMGVVLEKACKR
jgi:hypothetical protein